MRPLLIAVATMYAVVSPACAGTVVCALYGDDGNVREVIIPSDDRECNLLDDGDLNELRLPLSMWRYDGSFSSATSIAASVQRIITGLSEDAHHTD